MKMSVVVVVVDYVGFAKTQGDQSREQREHCEQNEGSTDSIYI